MINMYLLHLKWPSLTAKIGKRRKKSFIGSAPGEHFASQFCSLLFFHAHDEGETRHLKQKFGAGFFRHAHGTDFTDTL